MAISSDLHISDRIIIPVSELEFSAVRASGPGGQHVNKTNTAVELRFAIAPSSLPETVKSRLFAISDRRLNSDGIIVIKSSQHKSQKRNKDAACHRLIDMIRKAIYVPPARKATRPTRSSVKKRLDNKAKRGALKASRRAIKNSEE